MELSDRLKYDIKVKALNKSFTITGGLGQIDVTPRTNIYTLNELLRLGLVRRNSCSFYSPTDNLTFYCFTDHKKYQIIQICKGDIEGKREKI